MTTSGAAPSAKGGRIFAIGSGLLLLGALGLWLAFRVYTGICLEDALITYRYAENIASGQGFVFNPGEKVQGTTTPLLTLLLATAAWVAGPAAIPAASNALMMAAGLGAVWLAGLALRKAGYSTCVAFLSMALFLSNRDVLWTVTGGMETPLVLFFMAAGLCALVGGSWFWAALSSALLVLTRIDGIVWAGVIFLLLLFSLKGRVWKPILVFLVVVAPWYLFAWLYFGNPLPHSMLAKHAGGSENALFVSRNILDFLSWYARPLGLGVPPASGWLGWVFAYRFAILILGLAAVWTVRRERSACLALPLYLLLFGSVMLAGHAPRHFPWYLAPPTWAAILLGALGVNLVEQALQTRLGVREIAARGVAAALALLLIGVQLAMDVQAFGYHKKFQANEDGLRRRVGEWLRENTPAGASVAMEAIGYQGTFSRRRVIDLAGLISPEVVRLRREAPTPAGTLHKVLSELRPDYIVLRSSEVDENRHFYGGPFFETLGQKAYFESNYAEAARFVVPHPELWENRARITVYERNP